MSGAGTGRTLDQTSSLERLAAEVTAQLEHAPPHVRAYVEATTTVSRATESLDAFHRTFGEAAALERFAGNLQAAAEADARGFSSLDFLTAAARRRTKRRAAAEARELEAVKSFVPGLRAARRAAARDGRLIDDVAACLWRVRAATEPPGAAVEPSATAVAPTAARRSRRGRPMTPPEVIRLTDVVPAVAAAASLTAAQVGDRLAAALEGLPEPIPDEAWVSVDLLHPLPRRPGAAVSRQDLVGHVRNGATRFSGIVKRHVLEPTRMDAPRNGKRLVWSADCVFLARGWVRSVLARAGLADPWAPLPPGRLGGGAPIPEPDALRLTDLIRLWAEERAQDPICVQSTLGLVLEVGAGELTSDELWVSAVPALGPVPARTDRRVRRAGLVAYLRGQTSYARSDLPADDYLLRMVDPSAVFCSRRWLRGELETAGVALPAFLTPTAAPGAPAGTGQPLRETPPSLPSPPRRKTRWFRAAEAMAQAFWTTHGRWPDAAEAWAQLATAPPPGYPVTSDPDCPAKVLVMPGEKPLLRIAFERAWRRRSTPPGGP